MATWFRAFLRLILLVLFRFRVVNGEVLKTPGPVLLLPNHVSWIDWLFLWAVLDEDWRFVSSRTTARFSWFHRKVMCNPRTFVIDPISPYAVRDMTRYLQGGGRLVLFPEGHISRNGSLRKVFDGTSFLLLRSHAKVITCHLYGAKRLPWVRHKEWTCRFPKVSAHFSPILVPPARDPSVRISTMRSRLSTWVRDRMLEQQFDVESQIEPDNLLHTLSRMAQIFPSKQIIEDVTGARLNFKRFVFGTNLMAREWKKLLTGDSQTLVGVLLPNLAATVIVYASLWAVRRTPAILNFSSGISSMVDCAKLANLKQIITSKTFVDRVQLDLKPFQDIGIEIIYLEDVKKRIKPIKALTFALLFTIAAGLVDRMRTTKVQGNDLAFVLFTSGSEGTPKGVELTHSNVVSNCRQAAVPLDFLDSDRFFNALPLFHSFGLVLGTMLPLTRGIYVYLYPSPLHYRVISAVVYDRDCTVLVGTNTFLNAWAKRSHPYDFQSVRRIFAGGEKVQDATWMQWAAKCGIRMFEGYGATECSPLITYQSAVEPCVGGCGRFLPRMQYKLEPVEGVEKGGRLWVKGPNVMRGYLNADANAKFQAAEGWYDTGDVVHVDEDGFVFVVGRMKRFAKIGGEMVSLVAVEDKLITGLESQFGMRCNLAIIAAHDNEKGEHLVAITTHRELRLEQIRATLREKGLSNLAVPRVLIHLDEIPLLGTGKTDYRKLEAALTKRNA